MQNGVEAPTNGDNLCVEVQIELQLAILFNQIYLGQEIHMRELKM